MTTRLQGKVAIVTGSTSGIGAGIAKAYATEGAQVTITGRRQERGEQVAAEIREQGGQATFVQADLVVPEDCKRLCAATHERYGGLDILVNNTGIFTRQSFEDSDADFWDDMFNVNVRSAFLCSQSAVPMMQERGGGSIINIGSGAAFGRGGGRLFVYGCSKSALYGLSMKLAGQLVGDRIRVNWVTVGWVLTEMEYDVQSLEGRNPGDLNQIAERLPMGRFNTVEDIAAGCVFLASDDARNITASNLNISAGLSIHI